MDSTITVNTAPLNNLEFYLLTVGVLNKGGNGGYGREFLTNQLYKPQPRVEKILLI